MASDVPSHGIGESSLDQPDDSNECEIAASLIAHEILDELNRAGYTIAKLR